MNIVIGGSYHKFLKEINELHDKLEKNGHHVIAPVKNATPSKIDEHYNYVLFQGEDKKDPVKVQKNFVRNICKADAFVIYNKNGYLGMTAAAELGWAVGTISKIHNLKQKFGQVVGEIGSRIHSLKLKQIYFVEPITLIDTMKKKNNFAFCLEDIVNDPQYQQTIQYQKQDDSLIDHPKDYWWFMQIILEIESYGYVTMGIDSLLKERDYKEEDEER